MKIHDCPQGSPEWLAIRSRYPSASEFHNLVSPAKLKLREGEAIKSYVATKLAERWLGHPLQSFVGFSADQGKIREQEARPWYAIQFDCEIAVPGFVVSSDGRSGSSPDGLVLAEKRGLEVKCPEPDTHVGWLIAGGIPRDHLLQVQGGMLVCGYDAWSFLSYHPRFPAFVCDATRDQNICDALEEGIGRFWELFEAGWRRLLDANGGREPERNYDVSYGKDGSEVRSLKQQPAKPDHDNPVFTPDQLEWFNEGVEA